MREKKAEVFLKSIGIANPITVVDPTLLFTQNDWAYFCRSDNCEYDNYILIYAVGGEFNRLLKITQPLAKRLNKKILVITLSTRKKNVDYIVNNADPLRFVELIRDASFVITNSFHGSCFSIINKTPFLSVKYKPNPDRADNLLRRYNLQHRFYEEGYSIDERVFDNKDLLICEDLVSIDREKSWKWLKEAVLNG